MDNDTIQPTGQQSTETHYYYTCWPFPWGGWLCGVSLIAIGGGLFLQNLFPHNSEAVWGAVFVLLGVVVLLAAMRDSG